ncbi:MAG: hypothetical protein ABIR70_20395 [Bryobacteraceae bacterium]
MNFLALFLLIQGLGLAEPIPSILWGTWTVKKIVPTRTIFCWDDKEAKALLGTQLQYSAKEFRWRRTALQDPVAEVTTVTAEQFHDENSGRGALSSQVTFEQLGIREPQALQVKIAHPDANITAGTTEIPGDVLLVKSQNTIIFAVCGIYFEATRSGIRRK